MFQFPGFPSYTYLFSIWSMILHHRCSHIRKSADRSLFAAPRSLSQLITSFFGSQCQGILHMLFFAWTTYCILISIYSVLVSIAWIAVFHTCSYLDEVFFLFVRQNCFIFFYPFALTKKPDFVFLRLILFFPFTFVCHVCHTNSFELIWYICFSYSVFNEHCLTVVKLQIYLKSLLNLSEV